MGRQQLTDGEWPVLPDAHERAVCADPGACVVCVLDPAEGESRADWLARVAQLWAASTSTATECANGHPWTPETTRHQKDGARYCLFCKRGSERRFRERVAS